MRLLYYNIPSNRRSTVNFCFLQETINLFLAQEKFVNVLDLVLFPVPLVPVFNPNNVINFDMAIINGCRNGVWEKWSKISGVFKNGQLVHYI